MDQPVAQQPGAPRAPTHEPQPLDDLDLVPSSHAVFLDFDGVIADIAPRPDAVSVPAFRERVVAAWREATAGALALVSGREVGDIRNVFPGYEGAASGGHGAETEWPDGRREERSADVDTVAHVAREMKAFAERHDALLFEPKRLGGVLHYRADPALERVAWDKVRELLADRPDLEAQPAKMAVEVKPAGFSKGSVIRSFMEAAPFAGRTPFYAGDDTTDEAAFAVVNEMGGVSVKVGPGETAARYRTAAPDTFFDWMGRRVALDQKGTR